MIRAMPVVVAAGGLQPPRLDRPVGVRAMAGVVGAHQMAEAAVRRGHGDDGDARGGGRGAAPPACSPGETTLWRRPHQPPHIRRLKTW